MDELIQAFKNWIKAQDLDVSIVEENNDDFLIVTELVTGEIRFHDMGIIELSVDERDTDESLFYLHFQMKTLEHAMELFNEMIECALSAKPKSSHEILFSCSSGLTTSFFAEKVNEAAELLSLDYHVRAVAQNEIPVIGDQYELICIAPQISYQLTKLQKTLPHANIIKIPSQVFASYDAGEMIKIIQEHIEKKDDVEISKAQSYRDLTEHEKPILCLNIVRNSRRTHLMYAVYDSKNFVTYTNKVHKPKITINDIYDAIDIALCQEPEIECIGLSLPGIIHSNRLISSNYVVGLNDHNLDDLFTKKYHKKFVFNNDLNAAAVGYYATQSDYESLSFIYQPLYYRPGIGNIINGKLLTGAHNIAGEIKFAPINYSKPFMDLLKESGGGVEIISKEIVSLISIIDPEAIVVCSQLVENLDEVKKEITKYVESEEYIPHLIKVPSFHIYIFLGQLLLCIESLQKGK